MSASWIQTRTLNDGPHPHRKPTEGEEQRISYLTLHRIRQAVLTSLQEQGIDNVYIDLL